MNNFVDMIKKMAYDVEVLNNQIKVLGGWLDLRGTNITQLPDNLTVGGWLDLSGTNITQLPDNLTVGGSLELRGTNITQLPDNFTVGGWLDLRGANITQLPDNLTVGGLLDLRGTNITQLPDNLMVQGSIYGINNKNVKKVLEGYNEERKYIYYDRILWGNVKSIKNREGITIYKTSLGYCVVEEELSAHGKTLRQAMEDLTFKKMKDVDISKVVEEIKKTGKVTRSQYRIITGACQFGTEQFCKKHNIEELEEIELEQLRKILIDDYGAKKFWALVDKE